MKLLFTTPSIEQAEEALLLLESKGNCSPTLTPVGWHPRAAFHAFRDEGRANGVMFLPSFDQFMTLVLTLATLGFGLFVADRILHISWLPW